MHATVHLYNIYENKKSSRFAPMDRLNKSTREDRNNISQTNNKIKYFQDEQGNFFRNDMDGKYRGNQDTITALYKGEYIPFNRVIKIFESGDESTIIHEFAHWYLDTLDKYSSENEEIAEDMQAVRKFLWLFHYALPTLVSRICKK